MFTLWAEVLNGKPRGILEISSFLLERFPSSDFFFLHFTFFQNFILLGDVEFFPTRYIKCSTKIKKGQSLPKHPVLATSRRAF